MLYVPKYAFFCDFLLTLSNLPSLMKANQDDMKWVLENLNVRASLLVCWKLGGKGIHFVVPTYFSAKVLQPIQAMLNKCVFSKSWEIYIFKSVLSQSVIQLMLRKHFLWEHFLGTDSVSYCPVWDGLGFLMF